MTLARRFAIICPNFYPRTCGVGDHSLRVAQELLRRGHEVAIFTRQPAESHPEAPNLPVFGLPGGSPTAIGWRVRNETARFRPTDVILQYTSQMWDATRFGSIVPGLLAVGSKLGGARTMAIVHEAFIPRSRRPDLAVAGLAQRAEIMVLLAAADRVFVTTDTRAGWLEPFSRAVGKPRPDVARVGPAAIPVPARGGGPGRPRIGYFSTASVGKRFDVVLDAFALIAAELPEAELVLIGDLGPDDSPRVKNLADQIAAHPARDRVRRTGKLSLVQIAAEIASLDLYLFAMDTGANTRSSTLPVAFGSGLPVVALNGIETDAAVFHDGDNVVFARELSGAAFGEAALKLLRDPVARERVAAGARRTFEEVMSWSRITDTLLAA